MTDAAYKAQEWLEQLRDLRADADKTQREIELIESRINCAVSHYENTGAGRADLVVRQAQREDALLTYSLKKEEYERKYMRFVKQEFITFNLLDRMKRGLHAGIIISRYITLMTWPEIERLYKGRYKRRQLFREHAQALEEFAPLLEHEEPAAIKEAEAKIKEYQSRATA